MLTPRPPAEAATDTGTEAAPGASGDRGTGGVGRGIIGAVTATDRAADVFDIHVEVPTPWRRRVRWLVDLVGGAVSLGANGIGYRDAVTVWEDGEIVQRWIFDLPELCLERADQVRRDLARLSVDEFRDRWLDRPEGDHA